MPLGAWRRYFAAFRVGSQYGDMPAGASCAVSAACRHFADGYLGAGDMDPSIGPTQRVRQDGGEDVLATGNRGWPGAGSLQVAVDRRACDAELAAVACGDVHRYAEARSRALGRNG